MSIVGQPALLLQHKVTVTNAEMLTLPTVAKQILAAPGSGFAINFIQATLRAKFAAGAYTGASTTISWLVLRGPNGISSYIPNSSTASTPLTYLTTFLGATNKVVPLIPLQDTSDTAEQWGIISPAIASDTRENQAVDLIIDNGAVNLGGGNSANSLTVTIYYTIEAVP